MATLFLAFAPADRQRASALADGLRAAAHTVHIAPADEPAAGTDLRTADAFLYATSPRATPAGPTSPAAFPASASAAASPWAPPGPEAGAGAVARALEQARGLGIPTLEIHLSGDGPATGVDFRVPDAGAAFTLIGAIATAAAAGRVPSPGSAEPMRGAAATASSKWAPRGSLTPDDVRRIGFRKPPLGRRGYDEESVDKFLDQVESDLIARQAGGSLIHVALTAADVHAVAFLRPPFGRRGYDEEQVDHFLEEVRRTLTALDQDLAARGATIAKS